jgi:hypothetical protein
MLVLLLTGTWLLGASAFGEAGEVEHKGYKRNPKPAHCPKGAASKAGRDCPPNAPVPEELASCPKGYKVKQFAGLIIVPWDEEGLAQLWIWPDGTTDLIYPDTTGIRLSTPEDAIRIDYNYTAELERRKRQAYTDAMLGLADGIAKAGVVVSVTMLGGWTVAEVGPGFLIKEGGEYVFEELTGVPIITGPEDVPEFAAKRADAVVPSASRRWRVGHPIDAPTAAGREPSWSTVRQRYWKNRAANAAPGEFTPESLARMKKGRAAIDPHSGKPMELEHVVPQRTCAPGRHATVWELTPFEHAFLDRFRRGVTDALGRSWKWSHLDPRP